MQWDEKLKDEVKIFQNIVHNFFINKISSMIMIEKHGAWFVL
jgi:hypothetical protein